MREYHDLSVRLSKLLTLPEIDKVLREWLERKAEEMDKEFHLSEGVIAGNARVRNVLGLDPKPSPVAERVWCPDIVWQEEGLMASEGWRNKHLPKEGNKMGALLGEMVHPDIMFCGVCGTPRPAEKPRRLELWEELRDAGNITVWSKEFWENMAEAAKKWFREKVESVYFEKYCYKQDATDLKTELLREIKS